MSKDVYREPMMEMFHFETIQLVEQLEQCILRNEKSGTFDTESVNEIFRIMHTIKGSSAMMLFTGISKLAHSIEDLFYLMREEKPKKVDFSRLSDIVLEAIDFIKTELAKIENGDNADGDAGNLVAVIKEFLLKLKSGNKIVDKKDEDAAEQFDAKDQKYYIPSVKTFVEREKNIFRAIINFEDDCEMENIRSFAIIHSLKEKAEVLEYSPSDLIDNDESTELIRHEGFKIVLSTIQDIEEIRKFLADTAFVCKLSLEKVLNYELISQTKAKNLINLDDIDVGTLEKSIEPTAIRDNLPTVSKQNFISVNLVKLDKLMDLVGELVISESMVTRNPEIINLALDNFHKAARQLRKITSELQDMVMSIRMVPLTATFQKMNRIIRDMSKKLNKEVKLEIIGEETEVDKNIIENISDPLMHLIRNSIDHGLEPSTERLAKGKTEIGKITLEAKNAGGDVWIIVKDDGRGLDKERILKKAVENGLVKKPESELTDREIFSYVFMAGFSTKDKVTEFSGRGVGMDVVVKNVEKIGGSVAVDSTWGVGSAFSIKIPLTLAIIDGMVIKVGKSSFIVPTISIKESFRAKANDVIIDPDGNEMILIRGICYPVLRLHRFYKMKTDIQEIQDGIIMMVENEMGGLCIFADVLIGEQQVVVKPLPRYIRRVQGIAGCTLLGDGNISLISDVAGLINNQKER